MNTQIFSVRLSGTIIQRRPLISFRGKWLPEMGFVPGAPIKVMAVPGGIDFSLCGDETVEKIIHVISSDGKGCQTPKLAVSGEHIYSYGLALGDTLAARHEYGKIQVRKLPVTASNKYIIISSVKDTNDLCPRVFFSGTWLTELGFVQDALATISSEPGIMTFKLQDNDVEYRALVKYARKNRMQLLQVKKMSDPAIEVEGMCVEKSGFEVDDICSVHYEHGLIRLEKLDAEQLGFG